MLYLFQDFSYINFTIFNAVIEQQSTMMIKNNGFNIETHQPNFIQVLWLYRKRVIPQGGITPFVYRLCLVQANNTVHNSVFCVLQSELMHN